MTTNESVQFHMRFVTEKHQELIKTLDELVVALVGEKLEGKKNKGKEALTKANDLKASISKQDSPAWLPSLIQGLNHFQGNSWKQTHLIDHLIKNINQIKSHKWVFENPTDTAFDFDSIYEHYKAESRLPELFNDIVRILEEIQASGELDSLVMIKGLGKVIATLKKNKDGSYFSINGAWEFLITFLQNYMWGELSKIPVLGTAMEALEKTIKETNEEMFKVHANVQTEMENVVETEIKGLKNKSSFKFLAYDKTGAQLSAPKSLSVSESV
ncbi:hypothetical protein [Pseudoalteromonas sp. SCQQ13]|uniref:hypothetical protein n=1 Tax=Pseudoalteromonas sp. SCQQ13 TaxID=2792066 RepID=UPI001E4B7103|nr:hypothetical protein [Pseudoalteromonas sp. SCQQ13]